MTFDLIKSTHFFFGFDFDLSQSQFFKTDLVILNIFKF